MPLPLPLDTAMDVAGILVQTGRTIQGGEWVERFVREAEIAAAAAAAARLPHNQI